MHHELQRSARPQVQSLLLWVLLCLLPLQGLAGVLAQSVGALHFHAPNFDDAAPMQGWQDFRRQVDGSVHGVIAAHHVHAHLDRHHHADPDAGAVVVDGGGSEAVQAEDAPSGALGQVIGPLGDAVPTPAVAERGGWTTATGASLQSRPASLLERPPRAG